MRTLLVGIMFTAFGWYNQANAGQIDVPAQAPSIKSAVAMAAAGDVILVAPGVYSGDGSRDIVLSGKNLTIKSSGGSLNTTIIIGATGTNIHRFISIEDSPSATTTIDGFTINSGYVPLNDGSKGGAIYVGNAKVSLQVCRFLSNTACGGGAVFVNDSATCSIKSCIFEDNVAEYGGAIGAANGSSLTITNTRFRRNFADHAGGVLDLSGAVAGFSYCVLDSNRADYGGAVKVFDDAVVHLTNCTITRNKGWGGAAITNHGGSYFWTRSIIAFNGSGPLVSNISPDTISLECSDLYENWGGNFPAELAGFALVNGNFSLNPFFCSIGVFNFTLGSISPCLPTANSCGALIGSQTQGCTMTCFDSDGDFFGDPGHSSNDCATDNCPSIPNSDQLDADHDGIGDACDLCTDTDGDGFGNPGYPYSTCPVDNCPNNANPDQIDSDGDGIADGCDNCESISNIDQLDADQDSVGDVCDPCTDTDKDGFANPGYPASTCPTDNCKRHYNPLQEDSDADGVGDICDFVCGDADHNGAVTVSDIVKIINFIFGGGAASEPKFAADADCNMAISISDAVYLLNYIFKNGPAPCASCP